MSYAPIKEKDAVDPDRVDHLVVLAYSEASPASDQTPE
jgi:hypothetical protein